MKKICVITSTRAEYGLLRPVLSKLREDSELSLQLVVTGMHLSDEFGKTVCEIEKDSFEIAKEIEILLSSDSPCSVSKSMALAILGFADYIKDNRPDAVIVLGDRFEIAAACTAFVNERIPIVHLHGGETTEGAVDECYRHAITKMAYLHFTSNEQHRKRVIQLGESPSRVFNVGATGVENILSIEPMPLAALSESLGFPLEAGSFAVVTFHPVTLEANRAAIQCRELFRALDEYKDMKFIFTKANADAGGREINQLVDEYAQARENVIAVMSLGMKRYLSALHYAKMVIGNSSSGIIEAPSFHIPTINIGDRQKGRLQAETVINVLPETEDILKGMKKACSPEFAEICNAAQSPYGDGKTSDKIISILKDFLMNDKIDMKKKFFDIEFEV